MTAIDDFLDPVIRALSPELESTLTGHGTTAYLQGSTEMIAWGKINVPDVQLPFEGPPMPQAISYAEKAAGRNIKSMNAETKRRLQRTIANAIEKKSGIPKLRADIRKTFGEMRKGRAEAIARTETAEALEQSFMDRSKDLGVTGKRWVPVPGADDICLANAAEGDVPLNHTYSSGDVRVPAHPNCRCALAPVMLEGS